MSTHDQEQPTPLPQADAPPVDVALPDGQHPYAAVQSRQRETNGTWRYRPQIHLPSQTGKRRGHAGRPGPTAR
ncbi:hypothetical protein [Actinacidiphila yanglinensis]|nr:hypothetical protein [Actinacidiphila yanglinensis]